MSTWRCVWCGEERPDDEDGWPRLWCSVGCYEQHRKANPTCAWFRDLSKMNPWAKGEATV